MGDFRRDKNLIKRTITEESLFKLDSILEEVEKRLISQTAKGYCFLSFVIRYDDKGYRLFSFDELLTHFKAANNIEKIIFRLDVNPSQPPGMSKQEVIDIYISSLPDQYSYFAVEGSDIHWVNSTFTMLDDVLKNFPSKFSWIRDSWVQLIIQITGVIVIFVISLIASKYSSPFVNVENPLFLTFIFFFLIFSNTWTYLNPIILNLMFKVFPNIYFKRMDKSGLLETVHEKILAGFVTLVGVVILLSWDFIKSTLFEFINH